LRRPPIVLPLALAGALALATAAPAQTGPDTYTQTFTSAKRGVQAGATAKATFPQQRVIDEITVAYPSGTKFDASAETTCDKTQDEVSGTGGPGAVCPAGSKVLTGKAVAYVGANPAPSHFELVGYNRKGGLFLDIRLGGQTAFVAFPQIAGRRVITTLPRAPEINARITEFSLTFARTGSKAEPYLRTPKSCPKSGKLAGSVSARAAGATKTTMTTVRCSRRK
jgi:hypothetical protein